VAGPWGKRGIKDEGGSHYVIEKKHTKISALGDPIIYMKINGLSF
jgi:hypothetical protein